MKDIMIGDTGLVIENDDLVVGFSDLQHQEHILISQKGEVKDSPETGVGIADFINHEDKTELTAEVATEFTKDGMEVNRVKYDEQTEELEYDANYNS